MTRRLGSAAGLLGVWLALLACAAAPPPDEPAAIRPAADRDARIQQLEAAIAKDEAAIKAMISDPARVPGLREDPELIEIADRLPGLQAALAALRAETPLEPLDANPREDEATPDAAANTNASRGEASGDAE